MRTTLPAQPSAGHHGAQSSGLPCWAALPVSQSVFIRTDGGESLSADHVPARSTALDRPGGRPCVVMAHGVGATRDCGLGPFADGFAALGADVVVFDYRNFGLSSGEPRQLVSLKGQIADYRSAVAYARTLPGVDPEQIVLWGVSLSGGHVLKVAAADNRIAAVVSLTPAVDGLAAVAHMTRLNGLSAVPGMLRSAAADALAGLRGRPPVMLPTVGHPGEIAAMSSAGALEGMLSIAGPSWRNSVAARLLLRAPFYRPRTDAVHITCPVLIQIAADDKSAPPAAARRVARLMPATVREYSCDHFDVYPGASYFREVIDDQMSFIQQLDVHRAAGSAR